jgi:hypothetical protein
MMVCSARAGTAEPHRIAVVSEILTIALYVVSSLAISRSQALDNTGRREA